MAKIGSNVKIAKTALIGENVSIGSNTIIGEYSVIDGNVSIGQDCIVYGSVTIMGHTTIGDGNKIFPHAVLGTPPQDLKYNGEDTELIIGNKNLIREFCMFNPGTQGGGSITKIGDNNLFMAFVHVAHDCIIGNNNILANNATLGGHVEIGNHVNVGGLTPVHQFVKIGDGAMVAGASALAQDLPPYCMAEGNRAKIIGLNKFRMRKIMQSSQIDKINDFYKKIFSSNIPFRDMIKQELEDNKDDEEIVKICNFILQANRGIPYKKGGLND